MNQNLMKSKYYCLFIKIGDFKFMEKLLLEGEVFCKPFNYFKVFEQESFRNDKYEGASYIEQINNIKLLDPKTNRLFATAKSGQLYKHNLNDSGNIYCLYGIETSTLDLSSGETKAFNLDMNGFNFGDTAVVIYDPKEFIRRVKIEVKRNQFSFQYSPVVYYDHEQYQGELSPFYKSKIYSPQNEVRFWIPNKFENDLCFNIGNISDIATLLPKDEISKLGYSRIS